MKKLLLLPALFLLSCDEPREYVYVPAQEPTGYTVTLEVRECDGKLLVDFAGLEIGDGYALRATDATVDQNGTKHEWRVVATFGETE